MMMIFVFKCWKNGGPIRPHAAKKNLIGVVFGKTFFNLKQWPLVDISLASGRMMSESTVYFPCKYLSFADRR